jgi:hypothetical protein
MPDVAERFSDMGIMQSTSAQATAAQISPAFFDMMLSFWIALFVPKADISLSMSARHFTGS